MTRSHSPRRAGAALCTAAALFVSGCATTEQNEALGALIGAVGGGVLGAELGDAIGGRRGRLVGTVLGTGLGAMLGQQIARNLSERDRAMMNVETVHTLDGVKDGESVRVRLPESQKDLYITPTGTTYEHREQSVAHIRAVQPPPSGYEVLNSAYTTTTAVNLRSSPEIQPNNIIGVLPATEPVWVAGRTPDGQWLILQRSDGAIIGYVSSTYLLPSRALEASTPRLATMADTRSATVSGASSSPVIDLDAVLDTGPSAIDLDAIGVTQTVTQVASSCRTVTYNLDELVESNRVCRGENGIWHLS